MKKVKVCKRCSRFDTKELKEYTQQINCKLKTGCVARCGARHPELADKYFGLIDGNFVSYDTKEEFFGAMK
ncbi:hypothetical protein NSA47_08000 [Irregularibacter muris]|uniref:Uncharacterized protein n=1 Tax=Irregularibacter muris TaxID=1796619 RepID=A0AAE3HGB9_9FIRM|nr:hypothetical protein [Irregularibacter muris]MCR1898925.1 hypothetical protein [Irregularibacter muris]